MKANGIETESATTAGDVAELNNTNTTEEMSDPDKIATEEQPFDTSTQLSEMPEKQFTRLRSNSRTIQAFILVWIALAMAHVWFLFQIPGRHPDASLFRTIHAIGWIMAVAGVCCSGARPSGGRAYCILALLPYFVFWFPWGIIFALLGLNAYLGGRQLFGPHSISHEELETEFTRRKNSNREET